MGERAGAKPREKDHTNDSADDSGVQQWPLLADEPDTSVRLTDLKHVYHQQELTALGR